MKRKTLRRGDGATQKTPWLRSEVKRLQSSLRVAGYSLTIDGFFGKGVEEAVKAFQTKMNVAADGVVGGVTWGLLGDYLRQATGHIDQIVKNIMPDFRGDLDFIHLLEGHKGRPYWPGGQSGVTLDPGVDLGFADEELVRSQYESRLNYPQWQAIQRVFGVKEQAAKSAIGADPVLKGIRISREAADEIMPFVAKKYWIAIKTRFPAITDENAPAAVQTAMLSLAYNRGAGNRGLEVLREPLDAGDWARVANSVSAMQQDHSLAGIRTRRQWEGALILSELEENVIRGPTRTTI